MPHRIKNVYDEIISFDGLLRAVHDVEQGHRYGNRELKFWVDLEKNIHDISWKLSNMEIPKDTYYTFYVYEPKLRKIVSSDYVTKVIQRSIYNALNPLLYKSFISDTTACIYGRGNLYAAQRLSSWIDYVSETGQKWYYMKMDVWKFFYRIVHETLMELWEQKVADKRALKLIRHYCCEASIPFGLPLWADNPMEVPDSEMLWDVGVSIGGGLSHLEGNLYLDELDQIAKRKMGIKYYIRHADDIVFLGNDKAQMEDQFAEIKEFIETKRGLRFNNKTALRPVNIGLEFVGYWIEPGILRLRKSTTLRMKRKLRLAQELYRKHVLTLNDVSAKVYSYKGLMKYTDSAALDKSICDNLILTHDQG